MSNRYVTALWLCAGILLWHPVASQVPTRGEPVPPRTGAPLYNQNPPIFNLTASDIAALREKLNCIRNTTIVPFVSGHVAEFFEGRFNYSGACNRYSEAFSADILYPLDCGDAAWTCTDNPYNNTLFDSAVFFHRYVRYDDTSSTVVMSCTTAPVTSPLPLLVTQDGLAWVHSIKAIKVDPVRMACFDDDGVDGTLQTIILGGLIDLLSSLKGVDMNASIGITPPPLTTTATQVFFEQMVRGGLGNTTSVTLDPGSMVEEGGVDFNNIPTQLAYTTTLRVSVLHIVNNVSSTGHNRITTFNTSVYSTKQQEDFEQTFREAFLLDMGVGVVEGTAALIEPTEIANWYDKVYDIAASRTPVEAISIAPCHPNPPVASTAGDLRAYQPDLVNATFRCDMACPDGHAPICAELWDSFRADATGMDVLELNAIGASFDSSDPDIFTLGPRRAGRGSSIVPRTTQYTSMRVFHPTYTGELPCIDLLHRNVFKLVTSAPITLPQDCPVPDACITRMAFDFSECPELSGPLPAWMLASQCIRSVDVTNTQISSVAVPAPEVLQGAGTHERMRIFLRNTALTEPISQLLCIPDAYDWEVGTHYHPCGIMATYLPGLLIFLLSLFLLVGVIIVVRDSVSSKKTLRDKL